MNAVGIDVSKGKSTVAALRPMGELVFAPEDVSHSYGELEKLSYRILAMGEDTRVVMEATGRYHEPVASFLHEKGIFVSVVNPLAVHNFCTGGTVRKVKNDRKDALKLAKFCLDNWSELPEYTPMDTLRQQLKLFSRQYNLYMKNVVGLGSNLISLTDKVFPGVNELFSSPERADGHEKWIDFVLTFWHCECICNVSQNAFAERYRKWCKRNHYNFSMSKAGDIYAASCGHFTTLPKCSGTKVLIQTAAKELISAKETLASVKNEMINLAKQLPEYPTVIAMYGVGEITAAQLMAEVGDVRKFPNRNSLVAYAGIDPEVNQSGKMNQKSNSTTKRGSPHLRKTLFQIVQTYLKLSPQDEPVYQFLDKKRGEGKPYYVYMTAAENKFLRIYYARVKECMVALPTNSEDSKA